MDTLQHNLTVASNLCRACAIVYLIFYFVVQPGDSIIPAMLTVIINILIARLISKGYNWTKWALAVLTAIFIPLYIISLVMLKAFGWGEAGGLIISIMHITAVVYLFLPYQPIVQEEEK